MCAILDANMFGIFFGKEPDEDMRPIHNWLNGKNGTLLYSATEKFKEEWNHKVRDLGRLRSINKLKEISADDVLTQQGKLSDLESDDPHIIALALAAEPRARLLVSADKNLHADFKKMLRGNVYQNRKHRRLLTSDICPS